jgi:hypothetical protein
MAEHTPTPYKISDDNDFGDVYISGEGEHRIAICVRNPFCDDDPVTANAEFIILACNSFEALVEACNDSVLLLELYTERGLSKAGVTQYHATIKQLQAAIAAAKEAKE